MFAKKKGVTLSHTNFPLYTIRMVGDRHFLVAGGGGQAKTGVPNEIEIFELRRSQNTCISAKVSHYNTGKAAIMNSNVFPDGKDYIFAAGMDDTCRIYTLRYKIVTPKQDGEALDGLRKRKGNLTKSEERKSVTKVITFDISPEESIQTDFHKEGGFQKTVKFTNDHSVMVTGGADGFLRTWQFPKLKKLYEVKAHSDDIDDLDVSPAGNKIVTVSRDGKGFVWMTKDGSKSCELEWEPKSKTKYRPKHCRFTTVADKQETSLFTTNLPVVRGGSNPCYIIKWDTRTFVAKRNVATGKEIISAFTTSDDGVYLGVGMISGSVSVYIAFSLQKVYHVNESHSIFVTDLHFTPNTEPSREITGNYDFTLLSVGADNEIKMYQLEPRTMWSPLWAIFAFVLLYLIFWYVSANGL